MSSDENSTSAHIDSISSQEPEDSSLGGLEAEDLHSPVCWVLPSAAAVNSALQEARAVWHNRIISARGHADGSNPFPIDGLQCPICFNHYDHQARRIHCLVPCGHSLCAACLTGVRQPQRCPVCRVYVQSTMINWSVQSNLSGDVTQSTNCDGDRGASGEDLYVNHPGRPIPAVAQEGPDDNQLYQLLERYRVEIEQIYTEGMEPREPHQLSFTQNNLICKMKRDMQQFPRIEGHYNEIDTLLIPHWMRYHLKNSIERIQHYYQNVPPEMIERLPFCP